MPKENIIWLLTETVFSSIFSIAGEFAKVLYTAHALKLTLMSCKTLCVSGGLDDALNKIIQICKEQQTPFVFALGRRALGRACAKLVPVSVVGIFSYEGTDVSIQ